MEQCNADFDVLQVRRKKTVTPKDILGNEIDRGALVHIKVPESSMIARVVDVQHGFVVVTVTMPAPPDGVMPQCIVLKEPSRLVQADGPLPIRSN